MIKCLIVAIVSALIAYTITQARADKKTVRLHRHYDRELDKKYMQTFSSAWDAGNQYGYRQGHMHGTIGHHKD